MRWAVEATLMVMCIVTIGASSEISLLTDVRKKNMKFTSRFAQRKTRRNETSASASRKRKRLAKSLKSRRLVPENLEERRLLATITVTTNADNVTQDNDVTLREAIIAANTNQPVLNAANQPLANTKGDVGLDTIEFAAGLRGDFQLGATGDLDVTETLKIQDKNQIGQTGTAIRIIGAPNQRVFDVAAGAGNFEIEKLALQGNLTAGSNVVAGNGGLIQFLANPGTLTVKDSTVTGGAVSGANGQGGGIYSKEGNVVLTGSTVTGNNTQGASGHGAGIAVASGTVSVTDSTISGNQVAGATALGGGIHAGSGTVTVTRSSVINNQGGSFGGGINSAALTKIVESTIDNNKVTGGSGGGLNVTGTSLEVTRSTISDNAVTTGDGGGIRIYSTTATDTLTITNSTIDNNTANSANQDGGGVHSNVDVIVHNSTITNNKANDDGGGIFVQDPTNDNPKIRLTNSIVAKNTSTDGDDFFPDAEQKAEFANPATALTYITHSLVGTNVDTGLATSNSPNIVGGGTPVDPGLGPRKLNGGKTQTLLPTIGSPVIDKGDITKTPAGANDTDQRGTGFDRNVLGLASGSAQVDMGAVEFVPATTITVNALNDETTDTDGKTSLREAIARSNASAGSMDTIVFDAALTTPEGQQAIDLTPGLGQLLITDSVIITGPGSAELKVDAKTNSRVINIGATASNVSIEGLTVTGGKTTNGTPADPNFGPGAGAGIRVFHSGTGASKGKVSLKDTVVTGNRTEGAMGLGAGIGFYTTTGSALEITKSSLTNNVSTGMYSHGVGLSFYANTTAGSALTIDSSTVSGNTASGQGSRGGGIALYQNGCCSVQDVTINNSTVSGNKTQGTNGYGGGVYTSNSSLTLTNSTISGNTTDGATSFGGGIFSLNNNRLHIFSSTIVNNKVNAPTSNAGGIGLPGNPTAPVIRNSIIAGNMTAGTTAGTMDADMRATTAIFHDSLIGNRTTITGLTTSPIVNGKPTPDANGNLVGDGTNTLSAGLGELRNNGGMTETHAVLPTSFALNAGNVNAKGDATSVVMSHDPTIFWKFDELQPAGSTVVPDAEDSSTETEADDIDGTYKGTTLGAPGAGIGTGKSIEFIAAQKDTVEPKRTDANPRAIPATELGGSNYSVSLWFNADAAAKQTLFSASSKIAAREENIQIELEADNKVRFLNKGSVASEIKTGAYAPGTWHHVAAVRDGANMTLYLDGQVIGTPLTNAAGDLPAPLNIVLGQRHVESETQFFDGHMDHVAIFNDALTAAEVEAQFEAGNLAEFDQRGTPFKRVELNRVDMGAYELAAPTDASFIVTTLDDTINAGDGKVSLREAIQSANIDPDVNPITFDATLFADDGAQTMTLAGGEFAITTAMTITGPGTNELIIDAGNNSRVFNVGDTDADIAKALKVSISKLQLTKGKADDGAAANGPGDNGGAIFNAEDLTLSEVKVDASNATNLGGAVYSNAILNVVRSTLSGNKAAAGGAIGDAAAATTTVTDSTLSGNEATATTGGGVVSVGTLTAVNSTIANNMAKTDGGGIHSSATTKLTNVTVAGNSAAIAGGGLRIAAGAFTMDNSIVMANLVGTSPNDIIGTVATGSANNVVGSGNSGGLADGTASNKLVADFKTVLENNGTVVTLKNNGGPTETIAIVNGPAVDAGDVAKLPNDPADATKKIPNDQRGKNPDGDGFTRVINEKVDAGAYELQVVNQKPTITPDLPDVALAPNVATGDIAFTVADAETTDLTTLTVTATSSDKTVAADPVVTVGAAGARTIKVTPVADKADGETTITVTVKDDKGAEATDTFKFTIDQTKNTAPTITEIADQTIAPTGKTGDLTFTVGDAGDNPTPVANLKVAAVSSDLNVVEATGIVIAGDGAEKTITVTPKAGQTAKATATITVTVTDANLGKKDETFTVTVDPDADAAPTLADIADQTTTTGTATSPIPLTITDDLKQVADLDVTATSSNATLLPASGVVVSTGATRTVTLTPAAGQVGESTITVEVKDGKNTTTKTFKLTVSAPADTVPPTISPIADQPTKTGVATAAIPFTIADDKADLAAIVPTVTSSNTTVLPDTGIVLGGSGANRTITLTPAAGQNGTSKVTIKISDGTNEDTEEFNFVVSAEENNAPTISPIGNRATTPGTATPAISFTIADDKTDLTTITPSGTSSNTTLLPDTGISFGGTGANRTVTLTPAAGQTGTATVTIKISDGALEATESFDLVVDAGADTSPPTITEIANQSTTPGTATSAIEFTIADDKADLTTITPTGTSSNTTLLPDTGISFGGTGATRTVTLTPAAGQTGTATVTIKISDGTNEATRQFTLSVQPVIEVKSLPPTDEPDPAPLPKGPLPTTWTDQRSDLRQITIELPTAVQNPTADGLILRNLGVNADESTTDDKVVPLTDAQISLAANGTTLTLSFPSKALEDGVYQLEVKASLTGGDPLIITGNEENKLFVLKGDYNGDGAVSGGDSGSFSYWYLIDPASSSSKPSTYLDLAGALGLNVGDFVQFSQRFGRQIVFPKTGSGELIAPQAEGELIPSAVRADINGDGALTQSDALEVINAINRSHAEGEAIASNADVNGDGLLTAGDALYVINQLALDVASTQSSSDDDEESGSVDDLFSDNAQLDSLF